jgi:hypothetical protein
MVIKMYGSYNSLCVHYHELILIHFITSIWNIVIIILQYWSIPTSFTKFAWYWNTNLFSKLDFSPENFCRIGVSIFCQELLLAKPTDSLNEDRRFSGSDLKPGHPKYEAVLPPSYTVIT